MSRKNLLAGLWLVCVPALFAENIPGRYIVELSTEPVAEHVARLSIRDKLHSAVASTQRARIRTEQQQVRQRVEQQQAVVLDSVDTVANALLVSVPDNLSARLAALPGVKRVLPVRTMHLFLDRAVILHRISDAWNQIGTDQAGAGVGALTNEQHRGDAPRPARGPRAQAEAGVPGGACRRHRIDGVAPPVRVARTARS